MAETPEVKEKDCFRCLDRLPVTDFHVNNVKKDGRADYCKPCMKSYLKDLRAKGKAKAFSQKKRAAKRNLNFDDQPDSVKRIVYALTENPKISRLELSEKVGLSINTVNSYLCSNDFLSAVRKVGSQHVTGMIPKALNTLSQSLESPSEEVKLKAAVKVLENERVLGPNRIEIGMSDLSHKTIEELETIYNGVKLPPKPVLEAEVIS